MGVRSVIDSVYDHIVANKDSQTSVRNLAAKYTSQQIPISLKVDSFINDELRKLPGFYISISLPILNPINKNAINILYYQMCIVLTIAYMGGYDITLPEIRSFVYVCLLGSEANKAVSDLRYLTEEYPDVAWSHSIWRLEKRVKTNLIKNFAILPLHINKFDYEETVAIANNAKLAFIF